MEEHLGEEYQGLIISVQKYGVFVELAEVFVEGLLPLAALEEAAGTRLHLPRIRSLHRSVTPAAAP